MKHDGWQGVLQQGWIVEHKNNAPDLRWPVISVFCQRGIRSCCRRRCWTGGNASGRFCPGIYALGNSHQRSAYRRRKNSLQNWCKDIHHRIAKKSLGETQRSSHSRRLRRRCGATVPRRSGMYSGDLIASADHLLNINWSADHKFAIKINNRRRPAVGRPDIGLNCTLNKRYQRLRPLGGALRWGIGAAGSAAAAAE